MNKKLIHIATSKINDEKVNTVNARDLHRFLGVKRDYSTWIKDRIAQYGFVEGVDYIQISRSPISGSGNRGASIDHHLTLDTAKEISMVERNEKGKEARRYFIACEKQAKAISVAPAAKIAAPTTALSSSLLPPKWFGQAMGLALKERIEAWSAPIPKHLRYQPEARLRGLLGDCFKLPESNFKMTVEQFENCMLAIPMLDVNGFMGELPEFHPDEDEPEQLAHKRKLPQTMTTAAARRFCQQKK